MSYCAHCGAEVGREVPTCAACGKPPRSHARVAAQKKRRDPVLVTVVIAVGAMVAIAVLGIIAAIFIPNFLDALQKAKQKRTVMDTRSVGTAWMSWLTDEVSAASAGASTVYEFESLDQALTAAELGRQLRESPSGSPYIEAVPDLDGWGHAFEYRQSDNLLARHVMAIRSPGSDGLFSGSAYHQGTFAATDYDQDIVWADGYFVRAPTGLGPVAGGMSSALAPRPDEH